MAKIKLTPSQIALAKADFDELPIGSASIGDDGLAEVPETDDDRNDDFNESNYLPDNSEDVVAEADDEQDDDPGVDLPDWIDNESKAYAQSYGLSDDDLKSFDSRESLERFGEITDRRLAAQGAKHQEYQQPAPSKSAPQDTTDTMSVTEKSDEAFELFDPQKLIDERYDDTTVSIGKALRATQEQLQRVLPLAQAYQQDQQRSFQMREMDEFDQALDGLDGALFGTAYRDGKPVDMNPAHKANRQAVYSTMQQLRQGIAEESGGNVEIPQKVLVERAVRVAFGDVRNRPSGKDADRLAQQSRRRRPTGGRGGRTMAGPVRSTTGDEDAATIANSPKLKQFWQKVQRQNGMV